MRKLLVGALVAALTTVVLPTPVGASHNGHFTCRASVIRVQGQQGTPLEPVFFEPIVASEADGECTTEDASFINSQELPAGLGEVSVLYAETNNAPHDRATSRAGVVDVTLTLGGQVIEAEVLTAEAQAGPCPSTQMSGDSTVVGLTVNGTEIEVPEGHFEVPLGPLGTLHLNEQTTGPTEDGGQQLTQQALFLDTILADVVIAEAVVDTHGDPCDNGTERLPGWMTGGGFVAEPGTRQDQNGEGHVDPGTRVVHAFSLECYETEGVDGGPGKDNLVAQWFDDAEKEHASFKLTQINDTRCFNSGENTAQPPASDFNAIEGDGVGICKSGGAEVPVHIDFMFTDAGEPGTRDYARINTDLIEGVDTPDELAVICDNESEGFLDGGNHQAHQTPAQRGTSTSGPKPRP